MIKYNYYKLKSTNYNQYSLYRIFTSPISQSIATLRNSEPIPVFCKVQKALGGILRGGVARMVLFT